REPVRPTGPRCPLRGDDLPPRRIAAGARRLATRRSRHHHRAGKERSPEPENREPKDEAAQRALPHRRPTGEARRQVDAAARRMEELAAQGFTTKHTKGTKIPGQK